MATNDSTPCEILADDGTPVLFLRGRESAQRFIDANATPSPQPQPRPTVKA
jgi:hypothetical protein